jgi:hypothetical protein
VRIPPPSKGELRAQIEKLEGANAALKSKSREANRAAKAAARRIGELEAEITQLVPTPATASPYSAALGAASSLSAGGTLDRSTNLPIASSCSPTRVSRSSKSAADRRRRSSLLLRMNWARR